MLIMYLGMYNTYDLKAIYEFEAVIGLQWPQISGL
jgi:hypothetical protein